MHVIRLKEHIWKCVYSTEYIFQSYFWSKRQSIKLGKWNVLQIVWSEENNNNNNSSNIKSNLFFWKLGKQVTLVWVWYSCNGCAELSGTKHRSRNNDRRNKAVRRLFKVQTSFISSTQSHGWQIAQLARCWNKIIGYV